MVDSEVDTFELTEGQLDMLITACYGRSDWTPRGADDRRIGALVDKDLLYIKSMHRDIVKVRSIGRPLTCFSYPATAGYVVMVTDKGKEFVDKIDLSRRAAACVAEGDEAVVQSFVETLSTAELPELLSSKHEMLRCAASNRLEMCLQSMPTECLPEHLVDSDPVVREAVGRALDSRL